MDKKIIALTLALLLFIGSASAKDFIIEDSSNNNLLEVNGTSQNVEVPNGNLNLGNNNLNNIGGLQSCADSDYVGGDGTCYSDSTADEYDDWDWFMDGSEQKSVSSGQDAGIDSGNAISLSYNDARDIQVAVSASGLDGSYLSSGGGELDVSDSWIDEGSSDVDGSTIEYSSGTLNVVDSGITSTQLDESDTYSLGWSNLGISQSDVGPGDIPFSGNTGWSDLDISQSDIDYSDIPLSNHAGDQITWDSNNNEYDTNLNSLSSDSSISGSDYDGSSSRTWSVAWGDADDLGSSGGLNDNVVNGDELSDSFCLTDEVMVYDGNNWVCESKTGVGTDDQNLQEVLNEGDDAGGNPMTNIGSGSIDIDGSSAGNINLNSEELRNGDIVHSNDIVVGSYSTGSSSVDGGDIWVKNDVEIQGDILGAGADVAEKIKSESSLDAGTVVKISGNMSVDRTSESKDTDVAGVVSTDPAMVMAKERDGVPVAMTGTAPVKVTMENGNIKPGDKLTSSSTPGKAMKCNEIDTCTGALIGKALEPAEKPGEIKMLISMG